MKLTAEQYNILDFVLEQEDPDDYVIATGKSYSVKQFLETVFEYAGLDVESYVEIDERLFRPHEVPLLLGDASKAEKLLGWKNKTSMRDLAIMMYESDLESLKNNE